MLADNAALPKNSINKLHNSHFAIDTGNAAPVYVRQYPIAQSLHEAISA